MNTYEEIYHHGIKGMKWGVRRTPEQLGQRFKKTKEDIAAKKEARDKETHDKVMKSRSIFIVIVGFCLMRNFGPS